METEAENCGILSRLAQKLSKRKQKTDVEKVYAAVFLIMKNKRYAINDIYNQNAAAVVYYQAAQCSGFAAAFKYAMDYMHIYCIIVTGEISDGRQSSPHSWNIVKLNDICYHIDITTLAAEALTDITQLYRYRLLESDEQKRYQGYAWDSAKTPMCIEMKTGACGFHGGSTDGVKATRDERTEIDDRNLPNFTRLFDMQMKIKECVKKELHIMNSH